MNDILLFVDQLKKPQINTKKCLLQFSITYQLFNIIS